MRADALHNGSPETVNNPEEALTRLALQPHKKKVISAATLQRIAIGAFLDQLKSLCLQKNFSYTKRALKHYLKYLLPTALRQQLLNYAFKEARIYTLIDMLVFELLLTPGVIGFGIQSIRPFFRRQFTAVLYKLGNGLEHLSIEDPSWLRDFEMLPLALTRMTNLRSVTLRFLADDSMMAAIALNCHRLREMDVSNSTGVTDVGITALCYPAADALTATRSRKTSARPASGCLVWLPRRISGPSVMIDKRVPCKACADQSCIRSLCCLDVRGTTVTATGLCLISKVNPAVVVRF